MTETLLAQADTPAADRVGETAEQVVGAVEQAAETLSSGSVGDFFTNMLYAIAAIFFVFGLKMLSSPRTARQGNLVAAIGMFIAVVVTLLNTAEIHGYWVILAGLVAGSGIGAIAAARVPMTGMPEMVALFNGSGGAASVFVAMAEFWRFSGDALTLDVRISIVASVIIGMVT
jgi:NAD(P) transhydrogenase subunit beta